MGNTNDRNSGIELLRIILMYMIIVHHVIYHGGVLSSCSINSPNYFFASFFDVIAKYSVDVFALVSGYFMTAKSYGHTINKAIKLWLTALFYSISFPIVLGLTNVLTGKGQLITLTDYFRSLLPISFGNWYFNAYFISILLFPVVYKGISRMDKRELRILLGVLVVVCSFIPIFNDNWFNNGYSGFWIFSTIKVQLL